MSYAPPLGSPGLTNHLAAIFDFSPIWRASSHLSSYLFSLIRWIYNLFPFNSFTYAFISVVPSVWHILVRVCCDAVFSSVFYPIGAVSNGGYTNSPNGRRVGRRICSYCANWITRMPSIVFDVHTLVIGCKDQVCNMSVRCYECRDWSDSCKLALPHS